MNPEPLLLSYLLPIPDIESISYHSSEGEGSEELAISFSFIYIYMGATTYRGIHTNQPHYNRR